MSEKTKPRSKAPATSKGVRQAQAATTKKGIAREARAEYAAPVEKPARRSSRAKTMVVETRRGRPYEYFPVGRFVVVAPRIAGVKPIFKYTRVRVRRALYMIADGLSIQEVAQKLDNAFIPPDAIKEALELARNAFVKAHPPLRRVKRWV